MRFLTLCAALLFTGICSAENCTPGSLVDSYDNAGKPTDTLPWQSQYNDAPSWSIDQGEPPLPISAAVSKATEWERKKTKRNDFRVFSISLMPGGCPDKWVYWVHFTATDAGVEPKPSLVVVLMDGTVVGDRVAVKK